MFIIIIIFDSAEFFPCQECGTHFKNMLDTYPIKNNNRSEFRQYICFLHNQVNKRLNKTIFDCSKHEEVYGNPGGCGCKDSQSNSTQTVSE
jgi:FAD-linked sulfhydryl oxidase